MTGKSISIFTKRTNLSQYFETNFQKCCNEHSVDYSRDDAVNRLRCYYAKEQEVTLYVHSRYDGGKLLCEIKCPINPLPVVGEFTAASWTVLRNHLEMHGWKFIHTVPSTMTK